MSIHYSSTGKGPPVIFLHGFCEDHTLWNDFNLHLKGYSVFALDLPGFGKSEKIGGKFSIQDVALRLWNWSDPIVAETPVIVGHSLGGYVALAMARLLPGGLKGMVLFHSSVFADSDEKKANRNKVIEFVEKNGVSPFIETYVPSLFHQKDHPSIEKVLQVALSTPKETLLAYSLAMRDRQDQLDYIQHAAIPILILAGKHDGIIPLTISRKMADLSLKTEFYELQNSGHMGMLEEEQLSASRLEAFVKRCFS